MEPSLSPPFVPFFKLAQSNMALWTEFCLSPEVMWQPLLNPQRALSPGQDGAANGAAEAWSRLMKGVMENYSRFFAEVTQSGITQWSSRAAVAGAPAA